MNFIKPNWYREKRTDSENKSLYRTLRLFGYSWKEAQRMRYWSINHLKLKISADFEFYRGTK